MLQDPRTVFNNSKRKVIGVSVLKITPGMFFVFQFTESSRKQGIQSICCCLSLVRKM